MVPGDSHGKSQGFRGDSPGFPTDFQDDFSREGPEMPREVLGEIPFSHFRVLAHLGSFERSGLRAERGEGVPGTCRGRSVPLPFFV